MKRERDGRFKGRGAFFGLGRPVLISALAGSALGGGGYDVIADGAELPRERPPKLSHWAVRRFSP